MTHAVSVAAILLYGLMQYLGVVFLARGQEGTGKLKDSLPFPSPFRVWLRKGLATLQRAMGGSGIASHSLHSPRCHAASQWNTVQPSQASPAQSPEGSVMTTSRLPPWRYPRGLTIDTRESLAGLC